MTQTPYAEKDDQYIGIQVPAVQANSPAGRGYNSSNSHLPEDAEGATTSKSAHTVPFVSQPGLDNHPVGIPTLIREKSHATHDDAED